MVKLALFHAKSIDSIYLFCRPPPRLRLLLYMATINPTGTVRGACVAVGLGPRNFPPLPGEQRAAHEDHGRGDFGESTPVEGPGARPTAESHGRCEHSLTMKGKRVERKTLWIACCLLASSSLLHFSFSPALVLTSVPIDPSPLSSSLASTNRSGPHRGSPRG